MRSVIPIQGSGTGGKQQRAKVLLYMLEIDNGISYSLGQT